MNGPAISVNVNVSCYGCKYASEELYKELWGESGFDKHCNHPDFSEETDNRKYIGQDLFETPKWCPLYPTAWINDIEQVYNLVDSYDRNERE